MALGKGNIRVPTSPNQVPTTTSEWSEPPVTSLVSLYSPESKALAGIHQAVLVALLLVGVRPTTPLAPSGVTMRVVLFQARPPLLDAVAVPCARVIASVMKSKLGPCPVPDAGTIQLRITWALSKELAAVLDAINVCEPGSAFVPDQVVAGPTRLVLPPAYPMKTAVEAARLMEPWTWVLPTLLPAQEASPSGLSCVAERSKKVVVTADPSGFLVTYTNCTIGCVAVNDTDCWPGTLVLIGSWFQGA